MFLRGKLAFSEGEGECRINICANALPPSGVASAVGDRALQTFTCRAPKENTHRTYIKSKHRINRWWGSVKSIQSCFMEMIICLRL